MKKNNLSIIFIGDYLKLSIEWKTGIYTLIEIYVAIGTSLFMLLGEALKNKKD